MSFLMNSLSAHATIHVTSLAGHLCTFISTRQVNNISAAACLLQTANSPDGEHCQGDQQRQRVEQDVERGAHLSPQVGVSQHVERQERTHHQRQQCVHRRQVGQVATADTPHIG